MIFTVKDMEEIIQSLLRKGLNLQEALMVTYEEYGEELPDSEAAKIEEEE